MTHRASGFTLIEILAASLIAAMILIAIYGIFQRTVKTRDNAVVRIHEARQRERAVNIIRNDLRNAFLSGGVLANAMEGGVQNQKSRFPGYLRFTATTGRNKSGEAYGDVQQIEYYLSDGTTSGTATSAITPSASTTSDTETATLVRALTRDLLSTDQTAIAPEEPLLPRVQTLEFAFYDGQDWQETWQLTGTDSTLPEAIRVRVQQAPASEHLPTPHLLEILVPMTTEAQGATTSSSSTPASSITPTPTPTPSPSPSASPTSTPSPNDTPRTR